MLILISMTLTLMQGRQRQQFSVELSHGQKKKEDMFGHHHESMRGSFVRTGVVTTSELFIRSPGGTG